MSETAAVVLFGHGARDPQWARPMERARDMVRVDAPDLLVELAFLEFMKPTLPDAIDALVAAGASRITVVPMFLAQGGHLKKDMPILIEGARERHPGCDVRQSLAVGEVDAVIAAMVAHAIGSARSR